MKIFLFYLFLAIIALSLFALTIGQWLPVEFAERKVQYLFYDALFYSSPLAILLSLVGTVKSRNLKSTNAGIILFTVILAAGSFFYMVLNIFTIGFGVWIDESIVYRNVEDHNRTINVQMYDVGALGYAGRRTVELKPLTPLFHIVKEVDTTAIDTTEWKRVDEQGDIQWP